MKNLITGCQGVLRTTHNCRYLQSTDTVWKARTERCKVQELYTQRSLHLLEVTLPYLSHYLFSLQFFMQELKADTNAADASPRSLAFSLPFRTTPRTSLQFQTKKKSWLKLIFIDTTERCLNRRKSQEEIWGNAMRLLIAVIQNLQSVLGLIMKENARKSFQPTNPTDTKLLWKLLTLKQGCLFPKNLRITRKGLMLYHHCSTYCELQC